MFRKSEIPELYTINQLADVFSVIDALHTEVSEGRLIGGENRHLISWLNEVIYTAQETIEEINRSDPPRPVLRIVEKPKATQANNRH